MQLNGIEQAYTHYYNKQIETAVYVEITEDDNSIISQFAENATNLRWGKPCYKGTSKEALQSAFFLGCSGEIAVAKLLGESTDLLDFSVHGEAIEYANGDLECLGYLGVGVKVGKYGHFPMVVQSHLWTPGRCGDEIFCTVFNEDIVMNKGGYITGVKGVWINGIATESVLRKYQSRGYIISKNNPKYADMAAFYGFDQLNPLHDEYQINEFKAKYRIFQ